MEEGIMADFIAVAASNGPRLTNPEAVAEILKTFNLDEDLNVGIDLDQETGNSSLYLYGFAWPEAWKLTEGVTLANFDPYADGVYELGAEEFVQLLKEVAPHLAEPLTVHAIGNTKCHFPLSACEWHIEPGGKEVELNEFRHGFQVVSRTR
jgi:hypothetical protein